MNQRIHDLQPLEDTYAEATIIGSAVVAKALYSALENMRKEVNAGCVVRLEYSQARPIDQPEAPPEPLLVEIIHNETEFESMVRRRFPLMVKWPNE